MFKRDPEFAYIHCQAVKMIDGPDGFFVDGVMVAEEPDLVGEVWDYETSKANILTWSNRMAQKTNGQSAGNLRTMHGDNTTAAGRFMYVQPDDAQKLFAARAEVVDPIDQEKCRKGVYTGFSIKAPYARKWRDGRYTRWTSGIPVEVSLVDIPCIPSACFTMKMADGTESIMKFQSNAEEEQTMDVKELQVEFNKKFDALTAQVTDIATKMATAAKSAATKCMKSADECNDADCTEHGAAKSKAAAKSTTAVDYINTAVADAVKGLDLKKTIEDAIKAQFAPVESAMDTLTASVARMAGIPLPVAVKVNGAAVDKKDDTGTTDGTKVAEKSIGEVAKTSPVDAMKMIHAQGPTHVLTNRGLVNAQQ